VIEAYAPPRNKASLKVEPDPAKDIIVDDEEFYIAVTQQQQLDANGIQLPVVVAKVTRANWKSAQ
jgi:hypothetical protein